MKRTIPLLATAALGLWAPAAPAAAPSAAVRLTACAPALEQPARRMAVEGRMRTVPGARRLQMRFALQARLPDRPRWTRVAAPGFDVWNTADPAPGRYVFEKGVEALTAPARYRMVVRFRWLGADDKRLASAKRTSPSCAQTDLRPDLEPERIGVGAGEAPGTRRYVVPVRNAGRSAAGPFSVGLTVDGSALAPLSVVTGLPAGGRSELVFTGPECRPGSPLVAQVDAGSDVDERDEADDRLVRQCPSG